MGATMGSNVMASFVALAALALLGRAYAPPLIEALSQSSVEKGLSTGPAVSALTAPEPTDIVAGTEGWLFPGWDYLVDERPAQTQAAIDKSVEMATQAHARGSRVVLLLIPNKARVHMDHLPPDRAEWTRLHAEGLEKLADSLRERGLDVLVANARFYPRDAHWTAESGEAAARDVASHLSNLRRADGPILPTPRWIDEHRYGDLATLARSRGDLRWERDVFRRRDYVPPLAGAPVVEVVGNSLIDTYYGFPQELSRQLHAPVTHRVRYDGIGPWRAMQDYLDMDAPRPAVVWQLQETSFSNFGPASLE